MALPAMNISYEHEAITNSSDCSSDSEESCVDIVGTESRDGLSRSPRGYGSPRTDCRSPDSDRGIRTEDDAGHNNFSIDRILGIKEKKNEERRIQPVIPRASKEHKFID